MEITGEDFLKKYYKMMNDGNGKFCWKKGGIHLRGGSEGG